MQHENNRQRLERAFPPMDAAFDHAVRSTLENIVQEDTMQVKRPLRVLAITLALVICLAGTALAVGSGLNLFNFFEDIGSPSPTVQPEAYTLTAHDVASHSFEHTDVAVREASWDGRVLRILYSVRDRTVDHVFTDDEIWTEYERGSPFHRLKPEFLGRGCHPLAAGLPSAEELKEVPRLAEATTEVVREYFTFHHLLVPPFK